MRLIERISEFVAYFRMERKEEGREEESRDLESNSGVRSLLMASVTVSVTPVVRTEGFGGSSTMGCVISVGESQSGEIA